MRREEVTLGFEYLDCDAGEQDRFMDYDGKKMKILSD